MEESCAGVVTGPEPFKWAKSADVSYLPAGNGFVCGPNPPPRLLGTLGAALYSRFAALAIYFD